MNALDKADRFFDALMAGSSVGACIVIAVVLVKMAWTQAGILEVAIGVIAFGFLFAMADLTLRRLR